MESIEITAIVEVLIGDITRADLRDADGDGGKRATCVCWAHGLVRARKNRLKKKKPPFSILFMEEHLSKSLIKDNMHL